jgi:hypothetical protein
MKKKQEEIIHAREQQLAREKEAKLGGSAKNKFSHQKDSDAHRKPNKLSFADEWDEEEQEEEEEEKEEKLPVKNEEVGHHLSITKTVRNVDF